MCGIFDMPTAYRRGCSCTWKRGGGKNLCQASKDGKRSKCECQAASRECDPEVCGKCHSRCVDLLVLLKSPNLVRFLVKP